MLYLIEIKVCEEYVCFFEVFYYWMENFGQKYECNLENSISELCLCSWCKKLGEIQGNICIQIGVIICVLC